MNTKRTIAFITLAATAVATPLLGQDGEFGPSSYEFTIGGGGATDGEFDDASGGLDFSIGKYTSDSWLWSLRQSINFTDPEGPGSDWNGATRLAADYHFGDSQWRPLLGANVGYVYGDNVNDSWGAGVEGGIKYYVRPRTFIYGLVEYAWLFDDAQDIDETFDDGRFNWSVGLGFNF